jgi:hypothetical protein
MPMVLSYCGAGNAVILISWLFMPKEKLPLGFSRIIAAAFFLG